MPTPIEAIVIRLEAQVADLISDVKRAEQQIAKSNKRMAAEIRKLRREQGLQTEQTRRQTAEMRKQTATVKRASDTFRRLGQAVAAVYTARTVATLGADVLQAADAVRLLQARLNTVSGSPKAFDLAVKVSKELGAAVVDTGNLFTKLAVGSRGLGVPVERISEMAKVVLQLGRASGLSFSEVNYFTRQLAQGIGSGTFQGDELRSVRENLPVLAQEIARALTSLGHFGDVAAGDLKRLGKEGKLTAEVMIEALQYIADSGVAQSLFDSLPDTFEQAMNRIVTEWGLMLKALTADLAASGLYTEIANIGDVFAEVRVRVLTFGWEKLGFDIARKVGAGMLRRLADSFTPDLLKSLTDSLPEFVREALNKILDLPADLTNKLADQVEGGISDITDISDFEDVKAINWKEYYDPDTVLRIIETLTSYRQQLFREMRDVPPPPSVDRSFDPTTGQSISAAPAEYNEQKVRELYERIQELSAIIDSGGEKLRIMTEAHDAAGEGADRQAAAIKALKDQLADSIKDQQRAAKYAENLVAAYEKYGDVGVERQQLINKADEMYLQFEKKIGEEVPGARQKILDALIAESEARRQLELQQKAEAARTYEFGASSGGARAPGDFSDALTGVSSANERMRAELGALSVGGKKALQDLQDEYEINARVAEATTERSTDAYRQYIRGLITEQVKLERVHEQTVEGLDELSALGEQAAKDIQQKFADFLFDPFEDGLQGMLQGFVDIIRRMVAQFVALRLLGQGGIFGAGGLEGILSGFASGGRVSGGTPIIVGEKGPEIFVPSTDGQIIPNNQLPEVTSGAGASMGVHQVINIQQNIDARGNNAPSELLQMAPQFAEAIKRDIRDEMRRGFL
jgi:tape measure domain-containing protein